MVEYPVAANSDGRVIPVSIAKKKVDYTCLGCDRRMIPRQGRIVDWHFAHFRGGDCSSEETALHKTAKRLIKERFEAAKFAKVPFLVHTRCDSCRRSVAVDLTEAADFAVEEAPASPRLRPDVLFFSGAKPRFAAEVWVMSATTDAAKREYENLGLFAFVVKLDRDDWSKVWDFENGIPVTYWINYEVECEICDPPPVELIFDDTGAKQQAFSIPDDVGQPIQPVPIPEEPAIVESMSESDGRSLIGEAPTPPDLGTTHSPAPKPIIHPLVRFLNDLQEAVTRDPLLAAAAILASNTSRRVQPKPKANNPKKRAYQSRRGHYRKN